jgi:hypothetical protein
MKLNKELVILGLSPKQLRNQVLKSRQGYLFEVRSNLTLKKIPLTACANRNKLATSSLG